MPTDTPTTASEPAKAGPSSNATERPVDHDGGRAYVMPVVHVHVPALLVTGGFWGALAGAALVGSIDPPLAALIGAGVVVARHRASR